jgi:hypothetical protein
MRSVVCLSLLVTAELPLYVEGLDLSEYRRNVLVVALTAVVCSGNFCMALRGGGSGEREWFGTMKTKNKEIKKEKNNANYKIPVNSSWTTSPLKMGQIGYSETSLTIYSA